MLYSIWEDMQECLKQYHMRSMTETVNSMLMARFGAPLRKRLDPHKVTEIQLKNVAHNVRRIGYLEIMDGIIPHCGHLIGMKFGSAWNLNSLTVHLKNTFY
ncbi:MAG: hypothetical protein HF975_04160 [ANME-2 cluster archaeon]|nr:hypothetical protein [ANME-2 cluster archaeon]MBC2746194.1 hypothetical protein [ANME-2 cluster archaeon]